MITGIFIISPDGYTCSNEVTVTLGSKIIVAERCYTILNLPELTQEVKCVIKFDQAASMCFTAFVKDITPSRSIVLSIGSHFSADGVEELLEVIRKFNLYLLSEES